MTTGLHETRGLGQEHGRRWRHAVARGVLTAPGAYRAVAHLPAPGAAELAAFLAVLGRTEPTAPTRCGAWRVHELVAHLAAGSAEIARLVEARLGDGDGGPTRSFDDREPEYRALPHATLQRHFVAEAVRATVAIRRLSRRPGMRVAFTGEEMSGATLSLHGRCELAVHRWDIAGDDPVAWRLLASPELTAHSVWVLTTMTGLAEAFVNRAQRAEEESFVVRLRSRGIDDVEVASTVTEVTVRVVEPDDSPAVVLDPAARLLLLWGRRPDAGLEQVPDAVQRFLLA